MKTILKNTQTGRRKEDPGSEEYRTELICDIFRHYNEQGTYTQNTHSTQTHSEYRELLLFFKIYLFIFGCVGSLLLRAGFL